MNNRFEAIFEFATEGILTTDKKGHIKSVNPSCCRLFGYEEGELLEEKIEVLIPKRFGKHKAEREGYIKSPKARSMGKDLELFGLKKSGDEFPVEVSLSPFKSAGEVFIIAFIIDITNRKKNEEVERAYRKELEREVEDRTLILKEAIQKLEKTKQTLDDALQREKELNALKSKFVSIASHEFRTPLSTMLSSLVLIEKYSFKGDHEKIDKHILRVKNNIKGLTEILNDILSINKLEEGKIVANKEPMLLKSFLKEVIHNLSLVAKKGQNIELFFPFKEDIELLLDPKLMKHIIENLLSNAIKFSPEGAAVNLKVGVDIDSISLSIEDEGIGIPPESVKKLFTRFYRADNVGQVKGTGLGLSIVQQYTAILGGEVSVQSELNKGTTFTVILPVKSD